MLRAFSWIIGLVSLAVAGLALFFGMAQQSELRTVPWYLMHPAELAADIKTCSDHADLGDRCQIVGAAHLHRDANHFLAQSRQ